MFAQLLAPDTFEFFARYLLAGYVVIIVRARWVAGLRPKTAEQIVEAVLFSLIVQAVAGVLWSAYDLAPFNRPAGSIVLVLDVLVLPSLLGWLLGVNLSKGWNHAVLRRLSLPVIHPVRRAHDFAFGHNRRPGLVEITFEDGAKIAGWFGVDSLAATDDARSDLYLERSYVIDDEGNWNEPKEPRAVLVNLGNVRSIEFLLAKGDNDGNDTEDAG